MPSYDDLQLLQLALQEQARGSRPGVVPSALAQNAYFGSDLSRGNESRREQSVMDLQDANYAASVLANRKRTEGVNDAMAGDQIHRFNTRKNATVLPDKPLAFTPENFGPVASHAQPTLRGKMQKIAPDLPMAAEDSAFGDVTPLRTIKRAGTSTAFSDPDAAMSAAQRAMIDPRVIASEIGAGGKAAAATAKTDAAALAKKETDAKAEENRQEIVRLATKLRDSHDLAANVGPIDSWMPAWSTVRGGGMEGSFEFRRDAERLKSLLALESRGQLKGQGAVSDFEGRMLANSATSLNLGGGEGAFRDELDRIITSKGGGKGQVAKGTRGVVNGQPAVWDGQGWLPQ